MSFEFLMSFNKYVFIQRARVSSLKQRTLFGCHGTLFKLDYSYWINSNVSSTT